MNSITYIAKKKHISQRTLIRKFEDQWDKEIHSSFPILKEQVVLVIDGTEISSDCIVLIAYDVISDQPLGWYFVRREEYVTWYQLLRGISTYTNIHAVVSDGQKGLCKAVQELFPSIPHQRCLAHVIRLALAWLTRNPKTVAGVELRKIVCDLSLVKTKEVSLVWTKRFDEWNVAHHAFLHERSINIGTNRKRYIHRRLRGVRALLLGAVKNMFHFTEHPYIPNTSNAVEGGVNSPLKELLRRHRGLSTKKKRVLVSYFLIERRDRMKPTRNVS